jgi:hypothetical protein
MLLFLAASQQQKGTDMKDRVMMKTESTAGTAEHPSFETITLPRKDKSDVRWTGRRLAQVDSDTEARDGGRTKGRWARLQLWELESGAWLAASIGCSDREGEIDIGDIKVIPAAAVSGTDPRGDVMDFFGWSWLAKKLAAQLGWDIVEVIEE